MRRDHLTALTHLSEDLGLYDPDGQADQPDGWTWEGPTIGDENYVILHNDRIVASLDLDWSPPVGAPHVADDCPQIFGTEIADGLTRLIASLGGAS